MIKHIVMWKLKDQVGGVSKDENARELKGRLEALCDEIPEIKELEVGINTKASDAASDVVLYSAFESFEALHTYQEHPAHQQVGSFIRDIVTERRVVDYEM